MHPVRQLLALVLLAGAARAAEPTFVARTAAGREYRGPLFRLDADWSAEVGKGARHKVPSGELIELRQVGVALPPLPSDEHIVLNNGDRLPVRDVRMQDEKVFFRHPDIAGGAEASLPLSSVALIWRLAPDRVVVPEKLRRRLLAGKRPRDRVLLRNGDTIEGTLESIRGGEVEVEVSKKASRARWTQVSAVSLSTDLADKPRPPGLAARLVLTATATAPAAWLTVTSPSLVDGELRASTAFGATLRVPLSRVASLEVIGGKAVDLGDLAPAKYDYRPYLDEAWPWSRDSNVNGRDLRLGGSSHARGIGTHAHSRLTYRLDGAYRRFEAAVGLDDLDGKAGKARVRVLIDGKPAVLGKKELLTGGAAPLHIDVSLAGAKELTLEVTRVEDDPVQAVVNWVGARLVK
jgi:hypothetical protein